MESSVHRFRIVALTVLTLTCVVGVGLLGVLRPRPAYANDCANGACTGIVCQYASTYTCSFPDRNSCTTKRCAFLEE